MLCDVLEVIERGNVSDVEISKQCGISERQASYYRLALQSLLLIRVEKDRPVPTGLGQIVANLQENDKKRVVMKGLVLLNPAVRLVFSAIEGTPGGVSKSELVEVLLERTELSRTTAERRIGTIIQWLRSLKMIKRVSSKYLINEGFVS